MKERPILFSAPMVRALLDGAKTQTRRVVKATGRALRHGGGDPTPRPASGRLIYRDNGAWDDSPLVTVPIAACPYGQPGDRLWVRETWGPCDGGFCYRADEPSGSTAKPDDGRWHPSIHMFRVASRITLEISDVRVQRLQDISGSDAVAEGVYARLPDNGIAQCEFADLWRSINGADSWAANPWVWVVSFHRLEAAHG